MNILIRLVLVVGIMFSMANAFADDSQQTCTMICNTVNGTTFCHQVCT